MDEAINDVNDSWPSEEIPSDSFLYRQVHFSKVQKDGKRRFPSEAEFALHDKEDGLSVYWSKYITVKDIFLTIGLSYKANTSEYKNHTQFQIFQIPKKVFTACEDVEDVIHSPVHLGKPSAIGSPNIRAHSLVIMIDNPEVRVILSDYCQGAQDCYCEFKATSVNGELDALRAKAIGENPFHN